MQVRRECKSCFKTYDEAVEGDHDHCEECYYDPFSDDEE
jgi:protein-arginine kinase activator protein McsA